MSQIAQSSAWIIAKPGAVGMRRVRRLFTALAWPISGSPWVNNPHLTVEILFDPLPPIGKMREILSRLARSHQAFNVPAVGVVRQVGWSLSIELEKTPELIDLRQTIIDELHHLGAITHPDGSECWRPHLSVIGRQALESPWVPPANPEAMIGDFSFPVSTLSLSLPTDNPKRFHEYGPYRLIDMSSLASSQPKRFNGSLVPFQSPDQSVNTDRSLLSSLSSEGVGVIGKEINRRRIKRSISDSSASAGS